MVRDYPWFFGSSPSSRDLSAELAMAPLDSVGLLRVAEKPQSTVSVSAICTNALQSTRLTIERIVSSRVEKV